jgi:hypothetical protein
VGTRRLGHLVLDAGAFIAFEKNDAAVRTLVELAITHGGALHAPAGVVAQVWRDGSKQARLLGSGLVRIQVLDLPEAQASGAPFARGDQGC